MKKMRQGAAMFVIVAAVATTGAFAADTTSGGLNTDGFVHRVFQKEVQISVEGHPGRDLYDANCNACHDGSQPKAPHREALETMSPGAILRALDGGIMRQQAAHLSEAERRHITEYLTRVDLAKFKPAPGARMCEGAAKEFDLSKPPARAGWGYDTRRFIPAAAAGMGTSDVPALKLKWAFAFPDATRARSQPVVAMGAVFVGSEDGTVYAFDLETGCARWTSQVPGEVRTAVVVEPWDAGTKPASNPRLFFGDLLGRVYAMDALTGEVLWRTRPDDHPNATITGAPVPFDGKLLVPVSSLEMVTAADPDYPCCTFRGSLVALDPDKGEVIWKHFSIPGEARESRRTSVGTPMLGPSGAAVWGSPAVDRKRGVVYHGTGQNYSTPADGNSNAVFAVDLRTGKRKWVRQIVANDAWNSPCSMKNHPSCPLERGPDHDVSASPMLIDLGEGRDILIAGSKSGEVVGLDPDSGEILWRRKVGRGGVQGGVHFGMSAEGRVVYVAINDLRKQANGTVAPDYGFPGVHALDAATGAVLWQAIAPDRCNGRQFCDPGISSAITAIPGVVFAGHMDGWFRAYDGGTGRVLWEVDTTVPQPAVNGAPARGGSMSGPGATVIDGHLIFNSGYGFSNHMPGNALLVYAPMR